MPTYNRRLFVPKAIFYFLRQDYSNKELIIFDDGEDSVEDLIPQHPSIRYFRLEKKITLGAKLNLACEQAKGEILVNWDDDDWYAPNRIRYQTEELIRNKKSVCGINHLLYYNLKSQTAYQYIYPSSQRIWLLGSSLCYTKQLWQKNKFADINIGMDGLFVWATPPKEIKVLTDPTFAVHMIHPSNVSPKNTNGGWWHSYPVENLKNLMTSDWEHYHPLRNDSVPTLTPQENRVSDEQKTQPSDTLLKNVFACLVHEKEECIIDLIRNLRFLDPTSIILLYNGSKDSKLLKSRTIYEKLGVFIHPNPKPQQHGYLHTFALDCMDFALEHFSFDTFTNVDSDQLAIQPGYTQYLSRFFQKKSNIGLLSSKPARINSPKTENHIAKQAFNEKKLWQPLLDSFPNGDKSFVHWTFWPSTVFSQPAVKDLVCLCKTNPLAEDILSNTKIWATEEVIFPTFVRLLGYEIVENPCSYEFVQYKKDFSLAQVEKAIQKTSSYWIHPIPREYGNPLRKKIRTHFNHYSKRIASFPGIETNGLWKANLIEKIQNIEGWLTEKETSLLIDTVITACQESPSSDPIVEIGSYHGKATVLIGMIVKAFFTEVKVYSVDPHKGLLGSLDEGYHHVPCSFESLSINIKENDLQDVIQVYRKESVDVQIERPISLLLIDGLHDYPTVARDYYHFSRWITPGTFVVFHDYADYYPGVVAIVHELLNDAFSIISKADSLIVLKKRNENYQSSPTIDKKEFEV